MTVKRDENILKAAVEVAQSVGLAKMTRHRISHRANVGYGTVFNHLGDKQETIEAVLQYAIKHELLDLIADGISIRHPAALSAPVELRKKALATLL